MKPIMLWIALLSLVVSPTAFAGPVSALRGTWIDDNGRNVTLAQWQGRRYVISMSVGGCRKICTTTMRRMEQIQSLADQRGLQLEFIVVSLDPATDTPAEWREYRKLRGLQRPNWHFLGGDAVSTRQLANMLGIRYWSYDDHVLHDFRIALVGASGSIERTLQWSDDDPSVLLAGLESNRQSRSPVSERDHRRELSPAG